MVKMPSVMGNRLILVAATALLLGTAGTAAAQTNCDGSGSGGGGTDNGGNDGGGTPPTGATGDDGFSSTASDSEFSTTRAEEGEFSEGGDECSPSASETTTSQTKDVAVGVLTKINNQRASARRGNTSKGSKRRRSDAGALSYGGAASGDEAEGSLSGLSPWSLFAFDDMTERDREATVKGGGFEQSGNTFALGFDYRVDPDTYAGMSVTVVDSETDFDNNGGSSELGVWLLGVHGAKYWDEVSLSGLVAYGDMDLDIARNQSGTRFNGDTGGDFLMLDMSVSYEYSHGNGMRLSPSVRLFHLGGEVDAYREQAVGAATTVDYRAQDLESTLVTLSVTGDYSQLMEWGVLTPTVRFDLVNDLSDASTTTSQSSLTAAAISSQSDDPDELTANISAGLAAQFRGGLSAYAMYEQLLAHDYMERYSVIVGVRYELP